MQKILELIDEEEAIKLAKDLISYASPPGKVAQVGQFILEWYRQNGIETIRQDISEGRLNAIGIIRGTGRGLSLSLNGHMDIPYSGEQDDLLYMSKELFERPMHGTQAYVEGGTIYGLGVGNMKASLAAMMLAVKAIKRSGVELKGDLVAAAVEEMPSGKVQFGNYQEGSQSIQFEGSGVASSYMLNHGIHTNYAMCVDNSNLKLTWVQPGEVYLRITVFGLPGGAAYSTASVDRRNSQSAILKMMPVIDVVEKWCADYGTRKTYECKGGTLVPSAHITNIEAGTPYKVQMRPGICGITLFVTIPPNIKPLDIAKEIESHIEREGTSAKVEMYWSRLGYESKGVSGLVKVIADNYKNLFGSEVKIADSPYCSVWTDTNCYSEVGIPCVKIGLGISAEDRLKVGIDAYDSHPVDDIVRGARLYAMVALDVCSRTDTL